ncbi:MAG: hypothetical protein EPO07_01865 [Verrucomicrobia bacterium]|nr:MAG: hypothetical protein EPO07_01865 [Verrucomicrobiota bacterium]
MTNDVQKWGPWAGGLITGAESEHDELLHPSPRIYAVSPSGGVSFVKLGIAPEDFDLIKSNQDLYISAYNDGMILKLSRNWLTNYIGDMLVTQEGLSPFAPAVFIAKWNPTNSAFETRRISAPAFANSGFEHATFAPINLPNLPLP